MERWEYGDPCDVLERKQARELRRQRQNRKQQSPFIEDAPLTRRLEIPGHVTTALFQWGEWADRPQFWENLSATPFCKLIGIGSGRPIPEIKLDPQSVKIQKALYRMRCEITKTVLVGYYVAGKNWDSKQAMYQDMGLSREYFNTLLKRGSMELYNSSKIRSDE